MTFSPPELHFAIKCTQPVNMSYCTCILPVVYIFVDLAILCMHYDACTVPYAKHPVHQAYSGRNPEQDPSRIPSFPKPGSYRILVESCLFLYQDPT